MNIIVNVDKESSIKLQGSLCLSSANLAHLPSYEVLPRFSLLCDDQQRLANMVVQVSFFS